MAAVVCGSGWEVLARLGDDYRSSNYIISIVITKIYDVY